MRLKFVPMVLAGILLLAPPLRAAPELPDRNQPLWRSAVWPGWGQVYNGQTFKGLALGFLAFGTLGSVLTGDNTYFNDRETGIHFYSRDMFLISFGLIYAFGLYDAATNARPALVLSPLPGGAMVHYLALSF